MDATSHPLTTPTPSSRPAGWGAWTLAAFVLIFAVRAPSFWTPILDVDEAIFGCMGVSIAGGAVPYVEAADIKPPLVPLLYALVFRVFGAWNMLALHLFTAAWIALAALAVGRAGRRLAGDRAGVVAMLVFGAATSLGEPKLLASSINAFLMLPLALAWLFVLRARDGQRTWDLLACGALGAASTLVRVQAGIILLVAGADVLLNPVPFGRRVRGLFLLGIGALACTALVFLPLDLAGGLQEAINWGLLYSARYAMLGGALPFWSRFLPKTGLFLLATLPIVVLAGVGIAGLRDRFRARGPELTLAIWLLITWWPVCLGRRFYSHYYLMLLPPMALLAGIAFTRLPRVGLRRAFVAALAAWLGFYFLLRVDDVGLRQAVGYRVTDWEEVSTLQLPLADYVSRRTRPDERILVWGFAAPVFYGADRLPASRFVTSDVLVGRLGGGKRDISDPATFGLVNNDDLWRDFLGDLDRHRPPYVIDISTAGFGAFSEYPPERYPVGEWMRTHDYRYETEVSGARIFHRADHVPP